MHFVFEMFKTILLFLTQSDTSCNSLFRVADKSSTVVADIYNVTSSAYMDTLALFKTNGKSFVKVVNRSGPRQLTCGIPDGACLVLLLTFL